MSSAPSSPASVTADYFQSLAEGRVADALAALDPHVVWHQPGENRFSGVHIGPDAVAELIGGMMATSQGTFALAPTGPLMVNGELVAAPVRFTGAHNEGKLDQAGIDLLTVRDGKIVTVHLFSSNGQAEDAFWGPVEPADKD